MVIIAIVFLAVYLIVVALYANVIGELQDFHGEAKPGGASLVDLRLSPRDIDTGANKLLFELRVDPDSRLVTDGGFSPSDDLSIMVSGGDGTRQFDFPAGRLLSPVTVPVYAKGFVERWPFDTYRTDVLVVAYRSGGQKAQPIPASVTLDGHLPGWQTTMTPRDEGYAVPGRHGSRPVPSLRMDVHRAVSIKAFAAVLLAVMIAMPILVLAVSITKYRRHRRPEPALLGWMAAMLFATVPLRGFLPGSPPIGSWVDFLVVLWVIAGLGVGLATTVYAWLRWPDSPR